MSEIRNRYTGAVILSGECSVKELAETNKANLYDADLRGARLRCADLCSADLYRADLNGADLNGADLSGANLSEADLHKADLYGADLYGANLIEANLYGAKYGGETMLKYLSINPIGSRNDALQVFITQDNIYLRTGCWVGTPEALLERTAREDYKMTVNYIVSMAEMVRKEVQGG